MAVLFCLLFVFFGGVLSIENVHFLYNVLNTAAVLEICFDFRSPSPHPPLPNKTPKGRAV